MTKPKSPRISQDEFYSALAMHGPAGCSGRKLQAQLHEQLADRGVDTTYSGITQRLGRLEALGLARRTGHRSHEGCHIWRAIPRLRKAGGAKELQP